MSKFGKELIESEHDALAIAEGRAEPARAVVTTIPFAELSDRWKQNPEFIAEYERIWADMVSAFSLAAGLETGATEAENFWLATMKDFEEAQSEAEAKEILAKALINPLPLPDIFRGWLLGMIGVDPVTKEMTRGRFAVSVVKRRDYNHSQIHHRRVYISNRVAFEVRYGKKALLNQVMK